MTNEFYEKIMVVLSDIQVDIRELKVKYENLHTDKNTIQREINDRLDRHEYTLYGNGQPGLTTKVDALKDLPKEVKGLQHSQWLGFGGLTVILFVIKFLWKG